MVEKQHQQQIEFYKTNKLALSFIASPFLTVDII